jgi:predicted transglutaminase-like cysteine proteinase
MAPSAKPVSASEQRIREWHQLMRDLKAQPTLADEEKLQAVNAFFNRIEWVADLEHWGQEDYWATPVETLNTNGGDCEDFAIGKFFSLKAAGIEASRLRIHYVKALDYNQAHMVLAYYAAPGAEPLILDNIDKVIKPASQRQDLLPIYSFDVDGLWLAKARNVQKRVGSASSLKAWEEIKRRMALEVSLDSKGVL